MSTFKQMAREYLRNIPENEETSEDVLRDTLTNLEREEDLEERGTPQEASAAEVDEGAAPNTPSLQQLQEELIELADPENILRERGEHSEHLEEPAEAPDVPDVGIKTLPYNPDDHKGIPDRVNYDVDMRFFDQHGKRVNEDGSEYIAPETIIDVDWTIRDGKPVDKGVSFGLEKEADIKVEDFGGLVNTTIVPKDADFDAEAMIRELDSRVVPVPEYASPEIGELPPFDPLPNVNEFIRDVGSAAMFEAGGRVFDWERR